MPIPTEHCFLGKHEKLSIVQDCVLATSDFVITALVVPQVVHIPA